MNYTPRTVSIGQGSLVMSSEEFVNGYQAGHLAYMLESRAGVFTDEALINQIMMRLTSREHTIRYSAGYVVGLVTALASKDSKGNVLVADTLENRSARKNREEDAVSQRAPKAGW